MAHIDVYARWAGYVESCPTNPEEFVTKTHCYAVKIPPTIPLSVGVTVRVLAMSPTRYSRPGAPDELYDIYDAHVIGAVTKVLGWKGDVVGLEITNQCKINPVRHARLEVPYIADVTVRRLTGLQCGRGPRAATSSAFQVCKVQGTLAVEGQCEVAQCAMRATALRGEGIMDEYWLPGHRQPPLRRKSSAISRKRHGNLEALGWIADDMVDSVHR